MIKNWISNLSDHGDVKEKGLPTGGTGEGTENNESSSLSRSSSLDPSAPPPTTASAYYLKEEYKSPDRRQLPPQNIARGSQSSFTSTASSIDPDVHIFTPMILADSVAQQSPMDAQDSHATQPHDPSSVGGLTNDWPSEKSGDEDSVSFHDEDPELIYQVNEQDHNQQDQPSHRVEKVWAPTAQDNEQTYHVDDRYYHTEGTMGEVDQSMTPMETSVDESIDMAPVEDTEFSASHRYQTGTTNDEWNVSGTGHRHAHSDEAPVVVETVSPKEIDNASRAATIQGDAYQKREVFGYRASSSVPSSTVDTSHGLPDELDSVPPELDRLKEHSVRSKETFLNRVHELECKLAGLTAELAIESMDRENSLRGVKDRCLYRPFEELYERFSLQRDAYQHARSERKNWMELERQCSALDAKMTHAVYVDLQDRKRQSVDRIREDLEQTVSMEMPDLRAKVNKREGGMARQFDGLAGNMNKRFHEEQAARVAAVEVCSQDIKTYEDIDQKRADEFLEAIRQLRTSLADEREARLAGDTKNIERINQQSIHFKRVILNLVTVDDDDVDQTLLLKG